MLTTEFLEIANAICPERAAVIQDGRALSYEQLYDRVKRLAAVLAAQGVQQGDTLALLQVNTPQCLEVYFAAATLGAIYVPLNFRARPSELEYMINQSDAKLVLAGERYVAMVDAMRPQLSNVTHYIALDGPADGWHDYGAWVGAASADDAPWLEVPEEATTILMFTAGTTGFPKGVMLHHNSFASYVLSNVAPADPDEEERNLLTVPLYHIAGMQAVMAAIYGGRTLVMQRQFEPGEWMALVAKEKTSRAMMVPTMLKQILDHADFGAHDLSSLKVITYGAAPMPIEVISRALDLLPDVQFINAFGQTETAATITALSPEDHHIPAGLSEAERAHRLKRLSSVGKPLDDVEMRVVDEDGHDCGPNQTGEIVARGPRIMAGYWKDDEKTKATKRGGWIYTGDLGYIDDDGYYFLNGRASDMIIRAGENIAPEEVERVLATHPAVDECAVFGIPDVTWGETVAAAVVLKKGQQPTDTELADWCRKDLATFKKPERVLFLAELPRNPLGKVLRRELRAMCTEPAGA